MLRAISFLALAFTLSPAIAFSQTHTPPKQAIDITAAEIREVREKNEPPKTDQQLRVVDMGKYNLGVGIIHRGPTKDGEPMIGFTHDVTDEAYVILSGSGTLVTGGTMIHPTPIAKDSEPYLVLNGPTMQGNVKDGYSRVVGPGDVIIIPANVFHGWAQITDHIDYLSFRPDPDHVLPAGYIHPTIKK